MEAYFFHTSYFNPCVTPRDLSPSQRIPNANMVAAGIKISSNASLSNASNSRRPAIAIAHPNLELVRIVASSTISCGED